MSKMANRARMTVANTGAGNITFGAAVSGYQTFASAGIVNGDTISYAIEDGTNWEVGTGVYSSTGPTLSRNTVVASSASGATISITTAAQVFVTALASDLQAGMSATNLVERDSTGAIRLNDGTAAAPSLSRNNDDCGIFFPAADQLGISTNGTQRAVVSSSGLTLSSPLNVDSGGTGLNSLTAGRIPFGNGTSALGSSANLFWDSANSQLDLAAGTAALPALSTVSDNNTGLFYPAADTIAFSTGATERLRIDSSGNVGIGTSSPIAPLNVVGQIYQYKATGDNLSFRGFVNSTNNSYLRLENTSGSVDFLQGNGFAAFAANNSNPFVILTGGTERLRITSSGNVGIGTSSPGERLSVSGAITATTSIRSSGSTSGIGYATGAGGTVTQATSRTTGVTIDKVCGQITLVSAAGSTSWQSFTVTNSAVASTDTIIVNQDAGTDLYQIFVTNVAAGSFRITFATTGGTTTEQPVFGFSVIKAVAA